MPESTAKMRQIASGLSYNGHGCEPAAKHMLLAAASELDRLRSLQADRDSPVQGKAELPKPPLGLMPQYVWVYRRISEIMRAIIRYEDAGIAFPPEWCDELRAHLVASNQKADGAPASGAHVQRVVGCEQSNGEKP
jgi:hypothetical protein